MIVEFKKSPVCKRLMDLCYNRVNSFLPMTRNIILVICENFVEYNNLINNVTVKYWTENMIYKFIKSF